MVADDGTPSPGKADAALSERLHRFSHDLKNRLAGMYEAARLLGEEEAVIPPAEARGFFEQQFFKALRSVEDLMDDLGVERGVRSLRTTALSVAACLADAVQDSAGRYHAKEQHVRLEAPENLQWQGHADHLRKLLLALLSNASKFSPVGAEVRVMAREDGDQVTVSVEDPGVGLSPEDLARLFVRYAWLSSTSTAGEAQGRSTLALARQWALAMGGDLSATSDGPGAGTTFTLRLPKA